MKTKLISIVSLCIALGSYHAIAHEHPNAAEGEKKAATARSMPFRGKIDALDKAARTIKVGARQFQVVDATKIMKAGKTATLDEATMGEEVGGAYREADGGKLELVSLRLGAKPGKEGKDGKEGKEDKEETPDKEK